MTWDEFEEISRKIFAARGIGVAYGVGNSENPLTYYARGLLQCPVGRQRRAPHR
jgi:hypothetical protein